jgi:quercetin dioxygenase-like cupin family protein
MMRLLASVLLATSLVVVACGGDEDDGVPAVAAGVTEVVRQVLAEANPQTAESEVLELTRVVVPAGQGLPPHTHPGPQLAIIVYGTLTYTVIDGEAIVTRASGTSSSEVVTYASGDTFDLQEGDSISEAPQMVHRAANETDEPVVIYLSSLFPIGAEPATTVQ